MAAVTANKIAAVNMEPPRQLDKNRIALSFLRGRDSYDRHAGVQQEIGLRLLNMLETLPQEKYHNVLEIGCCTGGLTEQLLARVAVDRLYLNDLVPDFYDKVRARLRNSCRCEIVPCFGDIESIPLPEPLDLVISSSTFQWLSDLPALLQKIAATLQPSGVLAFSMFGPGTLGEFSELTDIGLEYQRLDSLRAQLQADFNIQILQSFEDRLIFKTPRDLLRNLQATGVCGVGGHSWTPQRLRNFEEQYVERFGDAFGVPLTYVSFCVVAAKKGN